MISRKQNVVDQTTKGIEFLMSKNKIKVYNGLGSFLDSHTVKIDNSSKIGNRTHSWAIVSHLVRIKKKRSSFILDVELIVLLCYFTDLCTYSQYISFIHIHFTYHKGNRQPLIQKYGRTDDFTQPQQQCQHCF